MSMSHRVLLVEDDVEMREAVALTVRRWAYDVREAATGPKALVVAAGWRPEVVLLDLGLPGMDGYEVARRLRELDIEGLKIVALSGSYPGRPDYFGVEFDFHIPKPFDDDALRGKLAEITRRKPVARTGGPGRTTVELEVARRLRYTAGGDGQ
jgi:two-component system, chemotaxis family, CheB/CheR fusion protein